MLIAVFVLSIILLFWFAPSSSFLRIYLFVHAYTSRKKHLLNAIDAPFFFLHCNFSTKIRLKIFFFFQTLFFFLVFSLTLNSILLSLSFIRSNCFPCGFFLVKKIHFFTELNQKMLNNLHWCFTIVDGFPKMHQPWKSIAWNMFVWFSSCFI